jgi:poly(hydroxyalkanoate) depolymerase family esterase
LPLFGASRARIAAAAALALLVVGQSPAGAAPAGDSGPVERSYTNAAGTRIYFLHVPPGGTTGKPLMVFLPGCTGSPEATRAQTSALATVADEMGFVLAVPVQDKAANAEYCWNWFTPANERRGRGEPSIIAGITSSLIDEFALDPARVYVGGYSAGGAMSTVMGAAYPDLYAAIAPMAGGPYRADTLSPNIFDGAVITDAMGRRARPIPVFFLQGVLDELSVYPLARLDLAQWLNADRRAGDPTVAQLPAEVSTTAPTPAVGFTTVAEDYRNRDGCQTAQFLTLIAADHVAGAKLFTDSSGAPIQRRMMRFLLSHRMTGPHQACR